MEYSESALDLGNAWNTFDALYGSKKDMARLTHKDRISELTRICAQYNLSYKCFTILENRLLARSA